MQSRKVSLSDPGLVEKNGHRGNAWKKAEDYGFDMSLIESNLRLSSWERLKRHDRALQAVMRLGRIKRQTV